MLFSIARSISACKDALAVTQPAAVRPNGHVAYVRLVEHEPHARIGQAPRRLRRPAPASAPRRFPSHRAGWIPPTTALRSMPFRFRESASRPPRESGRIIGSAHAALASRAARSRSACGARRYSGSSVMIARAPLRLLPAALAASCAGAARAQTRYAERYHEMRLVRPAAREWPLSNPGAPSPRNSAVLARRFHAVKEQRQLLHRVLQHALSHF